jgi:hypothetical protein
MKKFQNMAYGFGSAKWFWLLAQFQQALWLLVKGRATLCGCGREKSVLNMIIVSIILIGPGGLLLVISYRFCCPSFSFMGGVEK